MESKYTRRSMLAEEDEREASHISFSSFSASDSGIHASDSSSVHHRPGGTTLRSSSASDRIIGAAQLVRGSTSSETSKKLRLSELTINKLKIDFDHLIGRESEFATLRECLERLVTAHGQSPSPGEVDEVFLSLDFSEIKKELVYIRGYSGVGKTSLATAIESDVFQKYHGVFSTGKFDMTSGRGDAQPFSAISQAFSGICRWILGRPDAFIKRISAAMSNVVAGDLPVLAELVPELEDIVLDLDMSSMSSGPEPAAANPIRCYEAFRRFTRVLSCEIPLIVIVIDDLQWADSSSLHTINHLISDFQNLGRLMIIGCYRSNEVHDDDLLCQTIQGQKQSQKKAAYNLCEIELGVCTVETVNEMIMHMMSIDDPSETRDLAEVCYTRTLGNPYFLIEFMKMLDEEELLQFNLGTLRWNWDVPRVKENTVSTLNVVELLHLRLQKFSKRTQLILRSAACLGPSFTLPTLQIIWTSPIFANHFTEVGRDITLQDIERAMTESEITFLVEACGLDRYRWSHDNVQEAAMLLGVILPQKFHLMVGKALLASMDDKQLEDSIFIVADLVNKSDTSNAGNAQYASLNLRAAQKSVALSAFQSASNYAGHGIAWLTADKWQSQRDISLHLYTIGAQMALNLGNVKASENYSKEILDEQSFSVVETLPFRLTKAATLCNVQMKYMETIDYCVDLLRTLGCNLVWNRALVRFEAIVKLLRCIKVAKSTPKESYEKLERVTDPCRKAISHLVARAAYASFMANDIMLNALCVCKHVELTLQDGLSEYSPVALTNLANMAIAVQQDYKTASFLLEMSSLIKRMVDDSVASEYFYVTCNYGMPWTKPLQLSFRGFSRGYKIGMMQGQTDFAMWSLMALFITLPFATGKPLHHILENCPKVLAQMEELSQHAQSVALRVLWQMIHNLHIPGTVLPNRLEGTIFRASENKETIPWLEGIICFAEMQLLTFNSSDFQMAAEYAIQKGEIFAKMNPVVFLGMIETFHRGVALYAMARGSKRKIRYRRPARKIRRFFHGLAAKGNPNVQYFCLFLDAEEAAMEKNLGQAELFYKKAIVLSARTGNVHHAALMNERYADFLYYDRSDVQEGRYYINEAILFYNEWGACSKIESLQSKLEEWSAPKDPKQH